MAKRTHEDGDTALLDQPETEAAPLTREQARDSFVNRCLSEWGVAQFLAERGCDPKAEHVANLHEKAKRLFDRLFDKRPITSNLR